MLDKDIHDFLPPRRQEEPPIGVMRALQEQLPSGTNVRAALAIFLQRASQLPVPAKSVELPRSKDPRRAAEAPAAMSGVLVRLERADETAANDFAANLLMPARWVKERVRQGETLEHIATTFGVSELAMGFRFMTLGLTDPRAKD